MMRVDVFVPCYRYGKFLRDCVTSVLQQDGVVVRVLILDDHSPDDTPEVAQRLVSQDGRVEYRRHDINQGHIRTYNEGLDWVQGDCALLLSADDALTPGALFRAASVMNQRPDVVLVYGKRILIRGDAAAPTDDFIDHEWAAEIVTGPEFLERLCCANNPVCTPTAVV